MASWIGPIMNARREQVLLHKAMNSYSSESTKSWTRYWDKIAFELPWNAVKCLRLRMRRIHVPVSIQSDLLKVLLWTNSVYAKQRKKKRGKVFSHQLSQHDHHENDRLDVHFKYIFCVSLNLKSATFLGLQSDKGQIEFNLRESLWLWSTEPEILEQV